MWWNRCCPLATAAAAAGGGKELPAIAAVTASHSVMPRPMHLLEAVLEREQPHPGDARREHHREQHQRDRPEAQEEGRALRRG